MYPKIHVPYYLSFHSGFPQHHLSVHRHVNLPTLEGALDDLAENGSIQNMSLVCLHGAGLHPDISQAGCWCEESSGGLPGSNTWLHRSQLISHQHRKLTFFTVTFPNEGWVSKVLKDILPAKLWNKKCTNKLKKGFIYERVQPVGLVSLSCNWVILQNETKYRSKSNII